MLASDSSEQAVTLAERNLALLTVDGLTERLSTLRELAAEHGKASHERALAAGATLLSILTGGGGDLPGQAATVDFFDSARTAALTRRVRPDLVISDVPYGQCTNWRTPPLGDPVSSAIRSLATVVPEHGVIALSARTRKITLDQKIPVLERFRIGRRAVVLVRAGSARSSATMGM